MSIVFKSKAEDNNVIEVYTDGGCRSSATEKGAKVASTDLSAYAYFLKNGGHELLYGEAELGRTNNYMELKAVVEALKKINNINKAISIKSDSKYVVDSLNNGWMKGWKKRGWKKSDNSVPANVELWKELDEQLDRFSFIEINHVKGHSGNTYNELVDEHVNLLMDNYDSDKLKITNDNKQDNLTFEEVHMDWVNNNIKNAERAKIILQETYKFLESENFHSSIEAIEMLTGVEYN